MERKHENVAQQIYYNTSKSKHNNLRLTESGLVISSQWPFIGASPDGVINCTCCRQGVLEIKCPYCPRAYGGGFMGFQETPFDSKTISKTTCLNKHTIINILASYAY